jgi:putative hemolysin
MKNKYILILALALTGCTSTNDENRRFCFERGYDVRFIDDGWTTVCVTPNGHQTIGKIRHDESLENFKGRSL